MGDKPPWGSDEEFDPQKAWDLIQNLRGEAKTAKDDLAATKAKLSTAEGERDAARKKLTDKEAEGQTENEKFSGQLADLQQKLEQESNRRLRAEVASAKGLTAAQAKRLAGTTQEELEADADEILEAFPVSQNNGGGQKPPSRQPTGQQGSGSLAGGSDPSEHEEKIDIAKLADVIPPS